MKKFIFPGILFLVTGLFLSVGGQQAPKVSSYTFSAIKARQIGPARMSGRIAALDALATDARILYVGTASGGVWKSINGGVSFRPVFDKQIMSIGAVTIDQQRPDTVYVGTGEIWTRNSVSVGKGLYRTTDGGDNWELLGLEKTERIARILISPEDSSLLYVAALGHLWNANPERGVYRSKDGGKTWEKVLYVDENTGCSDLIMIPGRPGVLFAGMWDFRRQPWSFRSGGPGSGLYRSDDGGDSWERVTSVVFPDDSIGRIALAVSPVMPDRIYALIESPKTALYRSDDGGATWKRVNKTPAVTERPFYFSNIIADPVDTNRVWKPGLMLSYSKDTGRTFQRNLMSFGGGVHSDLHALWVSPANNHFMYLGTDGGVYVSNDQGKTWRMVRNLPVSQFYHVSVDQRRPYWVYGGLQDNGSWMGPSQSPGGVTNDVWKNIGGGDGFYAFSDPDDPSVIYSQSQGGEVSRVYLKTNEMKDIKPYADEETGKLRFNWNTPFLFGPSGSLYIGSQYLYCSADKGDTWERISPDLTTNDPAKLKQEKSGGVTIDNTAAENHCTIFTIGESPLDPDIIWVGTDDGNLQVTRDGGKSWTNVTGQVPDLPPHTWCSSVTPSRFQKGTAYVTFDGHRTGDMTPYVYKTTDYGLSWTSLRDKALEGYCHKIIEDTKAENLLFLGTEFGLWLSVDGGAHWARFTGDFPKVSVRDMVIQERENDLVAATHGRGILIIDDITPLRYLTPELLAKEMAFLPSRPYLLRNQGYSQEFPGDGEFMAPNPPEAALLTYYLKKRHIFGDMHIEVYDPDGKKIRDLAAGKRKGINRVQMPIRMKPPRVPTSKTLSFAGFFGPLMEPGTYTVKIIKEDQLLQGAFEIRDDPSLPYTEEDRALQRKTLMKAYHMLEDLAFLDRQVTGVMQQARERKKEGVSGSMQKKLDEVIREMQAIHVKLVETKAEGMFTSEEQLRQKIAAVYGGVVNFLGRPTNSQIQRLNVLEKEMGNYQGRYEEIFNTRVGRINLWLDRKGLKPIRPVTRETFNKEKEK